MERLGGGETRLGGRRGLEDEEERRGETRRGSEEEIMGNRESGRRSV